MSHADRAVVHARVEGSEPLAFAPARAPMRALFRPQLSVHHDLAELESAWRSFEQRADCTVFQTFDWLATWYKHIGHNAGVTPAIVAGHSPDGELLFIIPLAVARSAPGIRQLSFLGRDLGDYNAPLLAPEFSQFFDRERFRALWSEIRAQLQRSARSRHDMVLLDKMPEHVGGQANPFCHLDVALNPSGAYLTALSDDWETFYTAKRSSATRRRDRSKRKRLAESGEVRTVTCAQPDDIARTLQTLFHQKQRSFARMGVPNLFARPGYTDFFSDLAVNAPGHVHVSRLQIGDIAAATNLGLRFRGRYYHVLASYDDGDISRYGPGAAHLHELMRYAIETGLTEFDFTIGDEPYKRDWCDTELKLYDHLSATTPRGWLVMAPLLGWLRCKRALKQSPVLWPLIGRLRGAVAALGRRSGAPERMPERE